MKCNYALYTMHFSLNVIMHFRQCTLYIKCNYALYTMYFTLNVIMHSIQFTLDEM